MTILLIVKYVNAIPQLPEVVTLLHLSETTQCEKCLPHLASDML